MLLEIVIEEKLAPINEEIKFIEENKGRKLSDNEKQNVINVITYSRYYMGLCFDCPHLDFSKNFIIFCLNYYELGLTKKARQMFTFVSDDYLESKLLHDMEISLSYENLAEQLKSWGRPTHQLDKYYKKGDFFKMMIRATGHISNDDVLSKRSSFIKFHTEFKNRKFILRPATKLQVIKGGK